MSPLSWLRYCVTLHAVALNAVHHNRAWYTNLISQEQSQNRPGVLHSALQFSIEPGDPMKLLARNLDGSITEADLRDMFEGYGAVQSCNLVIDKETGISKGFAFIEMPKPGDAKAAMKNLNGKDIAGKRIRVKKAEPKQTADPV